MLMAAGQNSPLTMLPQTQFNSKKNGPHDWLKAVFLAAVFATTDCKTHVTTTGNTLMVTK